MIGLDRLHYGLWDGEELTLEGLKSAQKRYSEMLHSWIPEGVCSILDVGSGVGADALELTRAGYEVEGLAPDPYQKERFVARTGLPFHLTRFQEFESDKTYDLILMSESAQYIWLESLFDRAKRLAPGGHLLVADYFLTERVGERILKSTHPLVDFIGAAAEAGLEVELQQDITQAVLPTLELARSWLDRYVEPSLAIVSDSFESRRPRTHALVWPRVERALQKRLLDRGELDSAEFAQTKLYELLLLRIPSTTPNPVSP